MATQIITGRLADCLSHRIYTARVIIQDSRISAVEPLPEMDKYTHLPYILPGFIDAHVHIESSMLVPSSFARLAVVHGTVATVSDPHEIANVCGMDGVDFMIRDGHRVPFKFYFGAPSCVPATMFETAGATLDSRDVTSLLERAEIKYLSEMMNFPGALHEDPEVMAKIAAARRLGKPVDGHAPGLRGEDARTYVSRGISTDHECFTLDEALEKLSYGMKIIIREGSAARNFEALAPLVDTHPEMVMFCSDDKHPDSLVEGHINQLCARAVARGSNPLDVIRVACVNPVLHYALDVGLLRLGDPADFILVEDLVDFRVMETWINGQCVARLGTSLITQPADASSMQGEPVSPDLQKNLPQSASTALDHRKDPEKIPNLFDCRVRETADFAIAAGMEDKYRLPVIGAMDGQLITTKIESQPLRENHCWVADPGNDILKIVVVNRYRDAPIARAFIRNFGLKQGALASSVAHDSHNIVAVGVDDESLCRAVNGVIRHRGGISCVTEDLEMVLPLPVAGLMSMEDGYRVAELYTQIDQAAKAAGSTLRAPFMTLSFMALLVIPHLKLSDLGLFDGDKFEILDIRS
jgi:adenine deaminase